MRNKILMILFFIMLVFELSLAGVNLQNGNFHLTYSDIVVPGAGDELFIERTYNSLSHYTGWFGKGWGNRYETFLRVAADGSIVVHEHGSGSEVRFLSSRGADADSAVKKIIQAMKKKASNFTEKAAVEMEKKLRNNADLRRHYGRIYNIKAKISNGDVLTATYRGIQKLVKKNNEFRRYMSDGTIEHFNLKGRLIKISDKNNYAINLSYKGKNVSSIKDSYAKQIFFDWYPNGRIKALWSVDKKKKANYKYDAKNNLVYSKDVKENIYKYDYKNFPDLKDQRMVKVLYSDKTSMDIDYDSKKGMIKYLKQRNGDIINYSYDTNPKKPRLHFWTLVTFKSGSKKPYTDRYEYELQRLNDGSVFTYRVQTTVEGIKTETVYDPKSRLPVKIAKGNDVTTFKYDKKGLLLEKKSPREHVVLEYDKKINKIKKVKDKNGWSSFTYDSKGNLKTALNNLSQGVLLVYDRKGRISKMVSENKRTKKRKTLSFKYNAQDRPVKITWVNVGSIDVKYDNYGEVIDVSSKSGEKMAEGVRKTFEELLGIVRRAGVSLGA